MSRFTDIEYAKMRYKVYGNTRTDIVNDFPDMAAFAEVFYAPNLPPSIDANDLFRFFCYMYDMNSPGQVIPDLKKRKAWAMQMINIEPPYNDWWSKALQWQLEAVNRRAVVFWMVSSSEKYALWQYNLSKMIEMMSAEVKLTGLDEKGMQAAIGAEKNKNEIIKSLKIQIEESKREFLSGEQSKELEQEALVFTLKDTLGIRPEEWITNFEGEGNPFPDEHIEA